MSIFDKVGKFTSVSDLLGQIADGFSETDYLKDYAHGAKLMRPDGMALAPKQSFLFHVYFNLSDSSLMPEIQQDDGIVGALVKSVQLPSFTLDSKEYIQYNRKRLVHNRIDYQPVTFKFHDDSSNIVRSLWQKYYTYYFADGSYGYANDTGKQNYSTRDQYNDRKSEATRGWGVTASNDGDTKRPFFKDITIYGMARGKWVSYTLINPIISSWRHDTYDYSKADGVMEHEMQVKYEAVKYAHGENTDDIKGFGKDHPSRYDTKPGALGAGTAATTTGIGGIDDALSSIGSDLSNANYLGALRTAAISARTFGTVDNLKNVLLTDAAVFGKEKLLTGVAATGKSLAFPKAETSSVPKAKASTLKEDPR